MITTSATSQNRQKTNKKKKTCSGYEESGTGSAFFFLAKFGYLRQRNWGISVFLV
jgi:hypothetical protein